MRAKASKLVKACIAYAWLGGLATAIAISALYADRKARGVPEYPCCCDPFGYLQMAKDIRGVRADGRPEFVIESLHTRLLIDLMKSRNVPIPQWDDLVAPLAYHYFPETDQIGVQYPPGVGLLFALFPEGKALRRLNLLVAVIFGATGLLMLALAAVNHAWYSAGLVILSLDLGLEILGVIDNASFSINGILLPLLLCALCLFLTFGLQEDSRLTPVLRYVLVLLAGLFFGFAILVRMPVLLLMPGILLLLLPGRWRSWYKSACVIFIMGVVIGGIVPLALHQRQMAGAWYLTTYPRYDTSPPTLRAFWPNVHYYFGPGKGSSFVWIWPVAFAGCAGLFLLTSRRQSSRAPSPPFLRNLTWARLFASALLIWGISLAYFLTHPIANHVYPLPATLAAVLLLAFGAFHLERDSVRRNLSSRLSRRGAVLSMVGLVLALTPGLVVFSRAWVNDHPPSPERTPQRFSFPAELADERAWVWTSFLSGTLWYYERKAAHKISSSNAETRAIVFKFVRDRGEPQFIIGDDPGMKPVEDEIVQLGGVMELRGEVYGLRYYLIHWPLKDH